MRYFDVASKTPLEIGVRKNTLR